MYNTLPAVKKVSDGPLTLSEPVPKKGLSVEDLESRRTNIGVTRINVLFTTYCIYLLFSAFYKNMKNNSININKNLKI